MPLKAKILLVSILPLILLSIAISWIYQQQAQTLSNQQAKIFEETLISDKHKSLENYVTLAMNSIAPILDKLNAGLEQSRAEYQIKNTLRGLTYDSDGYFFAYDKIGVNLVHATQPELEGENLLDFQDETGQYVIRELLRVANEGGGFHKYIWQKPTDKSQRIKLSYVVIIPELNWMVGTGLYVDNIAADVLIMEEKVSANVRSSFLAATLLLLITLALVIVIVVVVNTHTAQLADKRLQELANRFITFQVIQRRGFSRELHDGINQLLVSTKLWLNIAERKWGETNAVEHLQKAENQLNIAIQEVRRISKHLRPMLLDDLGLESAIHELLDELEEQSDVSINRKIQLPKQRLPDAVEMTLYRVIQEAITNVRKHAKATTLSIKISNHSHNLRLKLCDNGCGFSTAENNDGIGLLNMRERVELLGGKFTLTSRTGGGTVVNAIFELNPKPVTDEPSFSDKVINI